MNFDNQFIHCELFVFRLLFKHTPEGTLEPECSAVSVKTEATLLWYELIANDAAVVTIDDCHQVTPAIFATVDVRYIDGPALVAVFSGRAAWL